MYFYEFIFIILFIFDKTGSEPIITETDVDSPSPGSIGIILLVRVNNTSKEDYTVDVRPDICCLEDDKSCDVMKIMGDDSCLIHGGSSKTLKLVAPILPPTNRQGYCTLYIDSKSNSRINKRDFVRVDFDTFIPNKKISRDMKYENKNDIDNNNPIDCDVFYNGKKSFYNKRLKRCVNIPLCFINNTTQNIVYNPISNRCVTKSIMKRDINILKILNSKDLNRKVKDVIIIKKKQKNGDTPSSAFDIVEVASPSTNLVENKEKNSNKLKQCDILDRFVLKYLRNYKWIIIVLTTITFVQCLLICTNCCLSKSCKCTNGKKIAKDYFKKDISITTPLIGTSNVNTGTVDYQNTIELSHNSNTPPRYYKSIQRETNENIKLSMSDDVLSKCINRRDWKSNRKETELENDNKIIEENNNLNESYAQKQIDNVNSNRSFQTRVVFEDEKLNINNSKDKTVTIASKLSDKSENSTINLNRASEEEIKCQNYSYETDVDAKLCLEKKSNYSVFNKSKTPSLSTEKAAQAYFSRDSIDDLLSERGYIYLAGENISRYTFSGDSFKKPSDISKKSSKNVMRYVNALFHKRSKHEARSDPGQSNDVDVELIHMSKASVYSSSNDSECVNNIKSNDVRTCP